MKKRSLILVIIILIIIFIILLAIFLDFSNIKAPDVRDCSFYSSSNCPNECLICPPCEACSSLVCQSKEFCNSLGFDENWSNIQRRTYCTQEQKQAQVCPEYYSPTCGWFNSSIQCFKYPCAQTFSNPCFACAESNVEYYTPGKCPE